MCPWKIGSPAQPSIIAHNFSFYKLFVGVRASCSRSNGFINVCMQIGLFTLIRATFFRGTNEARLFKKPCRLALFNADIFMDDVFESTEICCVQFSKIYSRYENICNGISSFSYQRACVTL